MPACYGLYRTFLHALPAVLIDSLREQLNEIQRIDKRITDTENVGYAN